ncbi:MAG: sigma-70 family RNA polymerase sigma factor [Chloroherpetonaceae bacterium]|nr:sigma-70 family RNA polymerase sigma factor [Chloroherpetonaceae bacterium]MCS7211367.1 sigma-70 family RNA polymerase sigma factor [Chloroherpetonaceae bacterium]MDW8018682.1 sigma-70 family RNA polymerase sigma factor [Chloroherpetonaceae bacterium]MDW8466289.1 sigma-70 family RNA polymerase sigma factor [Chloroherpetonaceae bacterium]
MPKKAATANSTTKTSKKNTGEKAAKERASPRQPTLRKSTQKSTSKEGVGKKKAVKKARSAEKITEESAAEKSGESRTQKSTEQQVTESKKQVQKARFPKKWRLSETLTETKVSPDFESPRAAKKPSFASPSEEEKAQPEREKSILLGEEEAADEVWSSEAELTEDLLPDEEVIETEKPTEDSEPEVEEEPEIEVELPKELEPKDEKPSSREEDYALIDIIREGNRREQEQAFKKLLSKYRGQIYNLILKIVHNPNEVDDLVQESFSKAFNSITNFNKEYAFSTWLYRIATNSSIDFLRKRRLKTFSIDNPIKTKDDEYTVEIPDSSEEPERNIIQKQRDTLVREAIEQLPPKYRTVIEMRHLQEMSYEEIAKALQIPLGTVKAHIFRAREMLYKMLRDKLRSY